MPQKPHLSRFGRGHLDKLIKDPTFHGGFRARLMQSASRNPDGEGWKSVSLLGELRYKRSIPLLEKTISIANDIAAGRRIGGPHRATDPQWLNFAVFALAAMDEPGTHAFLVDLALHADDTTVRAFAIEALGHEDLMFDPAPLVSLLEHSNEIFVVRAIWAIYAHKTDKDRELFLTHLAKALNHPSPDVRSAAVEAISLTHELGDIELIRPLLLDHATGELYPNPVSESARKAIAQVLQWTGNTDADPLGLDEARPARS